MGTDAAGDGFERPAKGAAGALEDERCIEQDLAYAREARRELAEGQCLSQEEVERRFGLRGKTG